MNPIQPRFASGFATGKRILKHSAPATARLTALLGLAGIAFAPLGKAAVVVFDNMSNYENGVSGTGIASTSSTPNYFMGDGYLLTPGTTSITGFDIFPVNQSGTSFIGLRINIYVWGSVNLSGTVNASTPAFSSLLAQY